MLCIRKFYLKLFKFSLKVLLVLNPLAKLFSPNINFMFHRSPALHPFMSEKGISHAFSMLVALSVHVLLTVLST